jgi:two-component system, cell cycle sensor histidine kinase and response regulator CckA
MYSPTVPKSFGSQKGGSTTVAEAKLPESPDLGLSRVPGRSTPEDALTWNDFFQAVPHPTMVIDRTHTVIAANPAVLRILNKTSDEILGRKCYELFHEDSRPVAGCPMERLLLERWTGVLEIEAQTPDSVSLISCVPICDERGDITHAIHMAVDVTDLKKAQQALLKSEEKYRCHFENISDVVISLDRALNIVDVSPSMEKLSGFKTEELVGKGLADLELLTPESLELAAANIARIFLGESNVTAEYSFVGSDGAERTVEVSASPLFSGGGTIVGVNAVARDITERRATEEALQESETKFRDLSEKSVAGIYLIQDGKFRYVNSMLAQIFGFTIEEIVDKMGPEDVVIPSDWPMVESNLRKRLEGEVESFHYEFRIGDKGKRIRTVEVYSSRTTYKGKPAVIGTLLDITERKKTEEALLRSEEKYRSIFENAAEGIFQTTPGGRILNVNPAFARMVGYETPEALIVCTTDVGSEIYVDPADRHRALTIMNEDGFLRDFETQFFRKNGTTIWVSLKGHPVRSADGSVLYYEGTAIDITEQKRAEKNLREAHQRLFDIIEFLPDGIFVIDQDKKVVAWNRAIEEMTGVTKEEIIGKGDYCYAVALYGEKRPILIDCVTSDPDQIRENYTAIARKGNVLYAETFVQSVYGGKGAFLSGNASPLLDQEGNIVGAIESIRDITELNRLENQLRQSQKMEAIGTLAGGIAHDFNNILSAITGYSTILQMDTCDESLRKQYLDQIVLAADKAANLTKSLLAFSRKQTIELKPQTLRGILLGIEKLLRRLLTEDIDFSLSVLDPDIVIMADVTQVDQVLINLATNARDAMSNGGTLVVKAERAVLDDSFLKAHGFGVPGEYALISVADTGCGMDKSTKEKIFEPFFTTKEVGRGTGLGLSTVYGIVKQHNGYIVVSSEPAQGSVFEVYIPAVTMQTSEATRVLQEARGGEETVLIAEDNGDLRTLLRTILEVKGYVVIEATDGADAVRQFLEHRDSINLLVLDVVMPKRNGKEVYEEIKAMRPAMKALFMSGYTGDVVIDKGVHDDMVDFISKPLLPNDLLAKVREVLDR